MDINKHTCFNLLKETIGIPVISIVSNETSPEIPIKKLYFKLKKKILISIP